MTGKRNVKELTIEAKLENIEKVIVFVNSELESKSCAADVIQRIDIALEELLVNVSHYAYKDEEGTVTVGISFPKEDLVQIDIRDRGVAYDPTMKEDPDVTVPLGQRKKGGLGIYMTKMVMDEMLYEYEAGYNHITLRKDIGKKDCQI